MRKDAGQILISGCRGSGKTTRQRELIEGRARVIALDPMDSGFKRGFKRCTSKAQLIAGIKDGWASGFKLQVPTGIERSACLAFIAEFVPLLFAVQEPYNTARRDMTGKEITLVVDEADLFFPSDRQAPAVQAAIDNITRRGRHYGIETVAATQRLAQVSTTYRGNCTEHYFFAQADHTDIDAALKILGREQRKALTALKPHCYLHKSMTVGGSVTLGKNRMNFR